MLIFPFLMSDYHLTICPSNGDGTIDWQSGAGTGGYSIVEHDPGVRSLTKRNPNYWKEGMAHFDEIVRLYKLQMPVPELTLFELILSIVIIMLI